MLAAGLVALATVAPLIQLLFRAFADGSDGVAAALLRPRTLQLLSSSITLTAGVGIGSLVLGIALAWAAVRVSLPTPRLWQMLLCLPLAVPSYVAAFSWVSLWPGMKGMLPLIAVMILATVPYVTVPVMSALALADHSLGDIARTLGRSRTSAFFSVTLPQILPAALGGALIAALYTLADFGAPALMRVETLTTGVYDLFRGTLDRTGPAALALTLVVLAVALVALERRVRRRAVMPLPTASRGSARVPLSRVGTATVIAGILLVSGAGIALPVGALVARMLTATRFATDLPVLAEAALTTVALGAIAAAVTVALGLPISHLSARYRSRLVSMLESASYVGQTIPGVVIALCLVALAITVAPEMYQTPLLLVAAFVILFLPRAISTTRSAISLVPRAAEEVSRTLGRGRFSTFLRISVHGAAPGVVAAWMLVMTSIMKELPATLMLRPIGLDTLATQLWSKTSIGAFGSAAPLALALVVVGLIPAWLLSRSIRTS